MGGPPPVVRAGSSGISVIRTGACSPAEVAPRPARYSQRRTRVRPANLEAEVGIAEARDVYSAVPRNGKTYSRISDMPGAWAEGELSTILRVTRDAIQHHNTDLTSRVESEDPEEFGISFRVVAGEYAWVLNVDSAHLARYRVKSCRHASGDHATLFRDTKVADISCFVPVSATYRVRCGEGFRRSDRTEAPFTDFRRYGASGANALIMRKNKARQGKN